ncbi:hypothetical protein RZS28_09405 [Methylocapsa polymorpha]|uniref:Uncharacterized protein n=1 Tax=Methylocapsa polymorpha TaxID=3080828 RepID=A0ABZ0HLB3_9HYPH|nr:hypothetical protein RZS28_09405 [Methylocapsa sp. RX1]
MLALSLPILNALLGGIINPLVNAWVMYKKDKLTTQEAGFEAATKSDAAVMQAALAAEARNNALKIQVYGHFINRAVMWVAGFPAALHFGLVFVDTVLAAKVFYGAAVLGVPKLPAPYDNYEWAIVTSFFLVQGVHLGTSNVSAWLGKSKSA